MEPKPLVCAFLITYVSERVTEILYMLDPQSSINDHSIILNCEVQVRENLIGCNENGKVDLMSSRPTRYSSLRRHG